MTSPNTPKKEPIPLPRLLVDHFIYQKNLALARTGVDLFARTPMNIDKAWNLYGEAMTKMAKILEKWNADPGVVMESCFAFARSKKHMDGPHLNMLGSADYLLKAVAYHMELPREAAADMMSREAMHKSLKRVAMTYEVQLRKHLQMVHGSDDPTVLLGEQAALELSMVTTVPPLYRFLLCPLSHPLGRLLLPAVLEDLRTDAKQRLWAQQCSWTYAGVAAYYNLVVKKHE